MTPAVYKTCIITMLMGWLVLVPASAGDMPAYYPQGFEHMGTIVSIEHNSGLITVDGQKCKFSAQAKVHTLRHKRGHKNELRKEMEVGFTLAAGKDGAANTIVEIWVLPVGSLDPI